MGDGRWTGGVEQSVGWVAARVGGAFLGRQTLRERNETTQHPEHYRNDRFMISGISTTSPIPHLPSPIYFTELFKNMGINCVTKA